MKNLKKITLLLLCVCLAVCMVGCGGDEYDNFKPAIVEIVDNLGGDRYEYVVEDERLAKEMWEKFDSLSIIEDNSAQVGSSYLYLEFYNKDKSTKAIFTIYENGSCCLGDDYETFYAVEGGRTAYVELCEIYETYDPDEK